MIEEMQLDGGSTMSLVYVPIGHEGALLAETAAHLALAVASERPNVGGKKDRDDPPTDRHTLSSHDLKLANRLLQQLSDLAATRLLHIVVVVHMDR